MRTSFKIFLLFIPLLIGARAVSGLTWDSKEIEIGNRGNQDEIQAAFRYHNNAEEVAHIMSILPSCGCVDAHSTSRVVDPGKSGELLVKFSAKNKFGRCVESVAVETTDSAKPILLTLVVKLPAIIQADKQVVVWSPTDNKSKRFVTVRSNVSKLANLKVEPSNSGFTTTLSEQSPTERRIEILPNLNSSESQAFLKVTAVDSAEHSQTLTIFAYRE